MPDIVERLRYGKGVESWWELGAEAADTIEALVDALMEIEALCHQETRQKLLAICQRAIAKTNRAPLDAA